VVAAVVGAQVLLEPYLLPPLVLHTQAHLLQRLVFHHHQGFLDMAVVVVELKLLLATQLVR
jgi:hypothetical protein